MKKHHKIGTVAYNKHNKVPSLVDDKLASERPNRLKMAVTGALWFFAPRLTGKRDLFRPHLANADHILMQAEKLGLMGWLWQKVSINPT